MIRRAKALGQRLLGARVAERRDSGAPALLTHDPAPDAGSATEPSADSAEPQSNAPAEAEKSGRLNMHDWIDRTRITLACRDADVIPRVADAGGFVQRDGVECQVMHNGVLIVRDCYYSEHMTSIIQYLRGIHEPQEELCFYEALKYMKPGATMIELGAYWAYYSLWFHKAVESAQCHLIEIDEGLLKIGIRNFELNEASGLFTHAGIGAPDYSDFSSPRKGAYLRGTAGGLVYDGSLRKPGLARNIPLLTIENYMEATEIRHCDILHCDIQGEEINMLNQSAAVFREGRVGWLFISTHHNDDFHARCLETVRDLQYKVLAEHNVADSFSGDGLIVARHPSAPGPETVPISLRRESIY
ncbi:MAG: FkbM family methyltransferase [Alphaproteobacteria bacterium]|nr:FkbM family methyltransferase [Alphaproteobacteria bacterium]